MKSKLGIISKCIAFFLILALLLMALYEVFPSSKDVTGIKYQPENSIDYLLIGDSECHSSISPMELWNAHGLVGYNCGVPAQRIEDTYHVLYTALQTQSPKVVMLETTVIHRGGRMKMLQSAAAHCIEKFVPLYESHNEWMNLASGNSYSEENQGDILKGFWNNRASNSYKGGDYSKPKKGSSKIGAMQRIYLEKIVSLCKENGIELILFSAPSPVCWNYEKHNAIEQFSKENDLKYIDLNLYNDKVGIDWATDTRDKGDHINFYGAQKVSAYIGDYLAQNTELEDRRGDPAYSSWDRQYDEYRAIMSI